MNILSYNPKIFSLFEVPVKLHISFLIFLAVMLLISPSSFPYILITFASVIPHEFGHILAARYYGIKCTQVVLTPFGGMAMLDTIDAHWKQEFWITLCGPLVSLGLGLALLPLGLLTMDWMPYLLGASIINFVLFVFNLLPVYPMDGGRLLRSALSAVLKVEEATMIAVRVSQTLAFSIGILALVKGMILLPLSMIFVTKLGQAELDHLNKKK